MEVNLQNPDYNSQLDPSGSCKDTRLLANDGGSFWTSRALLAINSSLKSTFKEFSMEESIVISVELNSTEVKMVLDFIHQGLAPYLGESKVNVFKLFGISFEGKKFTKILSKLETVDENPYRAEPAVETMADYIPMPIAISMDEPDTDSEDDDKFKLEDEDSTYEEEDIDDLMQLPLPETMPEDQKPYEGFSQPEKKKRKRGASDGTTPGSKRSRTPGKCDLCQKEYKNIRAHMNGMHSEDKDHLPCDTCGKVFKNRILWKKHVRDTHKNICCDLCGKMFSKEIAMKNHKLTMHGNGERPFKCEECPKDFVTQTKLKEHVKIYHGDTSFTCEVCGYISKIMYNLKKHMETHYPPDIKAKLPKKRYVNPPGLVLHNDGKLYPRKREFRPRIDVEDQDLKKVGKNEWECKVCQVIIKGKAIIAKRHVILQHGKEEDKPYPCHLCNMRFLQNCTLKLHIARHENKRAFACGYCDKKFNVASCRDMHERHLHLGMPKRAVFNSSRKKFDGNETVEMRRDRWLKEANESSANQNGNGVKQ